MSPAFASPRVFGPVSTPFFVFLFAAATILSCTIAPGAPPASSTADSALLVPPRTQLDRVFEYRDLSTGLPLEHAGTASTEPLDEAGRTYLLLTRAAQFQSGAAWYPQQVPIVAGFVTRFLTRFREAGTSTNFPAGADGLTLVIQRDGVDALGGFGCGIGYSGISPSVSIEFDTFDNSGVCNLMDPNGNHVSINAGGSVDERTRIQNTGTALAVNLKDGETHDVGIAYFDRVLRVFIDSFDQPVLSAEVDIGALLGAPDSPAWVGFTAGTGSSFETHEVLRWSFDAARIVPCGGSVSGEAAPGLVTYRVDVGSASGSAIFDFAKLGGARFTVRYQDQTLYDSGCTQQAVGTVPVSWRGTSTQLLVDVLSVCGVGPFGGWGFEVSCPLQPSSTIYFGADTNSAAQTVTSCTAGHMDFYAGRVGVPAEMPSRPTNGVPCSIVDSTTGHDVLTGDPPRGNTCAFNAASAQLAGRERTYAYWYLRGPRDYATPFNCTGNARDQNGCVVTPAMRTNARDYARRQAEAAAAQIVRYGPVIGGRVLFADIEESQVVTPTSPEEAGWIVCSEGLGNSCPASVELDEIVLQEFLERTVELGYIPGIYTNATFYTRYFHADFVPYYQRGAHQGRQIPVVLWTTSCGATCGPRVFSVTEVAQHLPGALGTVLAGASAILWQYHLPGDPVHNPACVHPVQVDLDASFQDGIRILTPQIPPIVDPAICQ